MSFKQNHECWEKDAESNPNANTCDEKEKEPESSCKNTPMEETMESANMCMSFLTDKNPRSGNCGGDDTNVHNPGIYNNSASNIPNTGVQSRAQRNLCAPERGVLLHEVHNESKNIGGCCENNSNNFAFEVHNDSDSMRNSVVPERGAPLHASHRKSTQMDSSQSCCTKEHTFTEANEHKRTFASYTVFEATHDRIKRPKTQSHRQPDAMMNEQELAGDCAMLQGQEARRREPLRVTPPQSYSRHERPPGQVRGGQTEPSVSPGKS